MTTDPNPEATWSQSHASLIDQLCDRFEAQFKAGSRPKIEAFLKQAPPDAAGTLLLELLLVELEYAHLSGDTPSMQAYASRFPEHLATVAEAFDRGGRSTRLGGYDTNTFDDQSPQAFSHLAKDSQRFRPLHLHARGGLGEVYLAEDERLRRRVALKQIQPQFGNHAEARGRFFREARLTGYLEHPGIVPIYDLGETRQGLPFYAMRFIHGECLKDVIDRWHRAELHSAALQPVPAAAPSGSSSQASAVGKSSATGKPGGVQKKVLREREVEYRSLLQRFVDVCNAVAYAHSKGVIHRDLKPANIMLGEFGETLVVDWGLAKRMEKVHADESITKMVAVADSNPGDTGQGQVLGTPQFMSPEQAAGHLAGLGPATDVFGLGAILYYLLTGQAPYTGGTVKTVLEGAKQARFARPRDISKQVPRPLEAICLKAMSWLPADRYASVKELAEDIERFLADERVQAWPEPVTRRVARWFRKHKAWTVGGLSTAAAVTTVSLVALGFVANANGRERTARKTAENNLTLAMSQRDLALGAFDDLVVHVQDQLKDTPATHELRKQLLERALHGLDEVIRQAGPSAKADFKVATAEMRLGDLMLELSGNVTEAIQHFKKANGMLQTLTLESADPQARHLLATSHQKMGESLLKQNLVQDALAQHGLAHDIWQTLAADQPDSVIRKVDLIDARICLAEAEMTLGHLAEAIKWAQDARTTCDLLAQKAPADDTAARSLYRSEMALGTLFMQAGNPEQALEAVANANRLAEKAVEQAPQGVGNRYDLCAARNAWGASLAMLGEFQLAAEKYRQGLELATHLAELEPHSAEASRYVWVSRRNLGEALQYMENLPAAMLEFRHARGNAEQRSAQDPGNFETRRDLWLSLLDEGKTLVAMDDAWQGMLRLQQAVRVAKELAKVDVTDALAERDLGVTYDKLAEAAKALGDFETARLWGLQAVNTHQRLASASPNSFDFATNVVASLGNLSDVSLSLHRIPECKEQAEQALQKLNAALAGRPAQPMHASWQQELALRVRRCDACLAVAQDLAAFETCPAEFQVEALTYRGYALAAQKNFEDVAVCAEKLAALDPASAEHALAAARCYAFCVGQISHMRRAPQMLADRAKYLQLAVSQLTRVRTLDPDLDFGSDLSLVPLGYSADASRAAFYAVLPDRDPQRFGLSAYSALLEVGLRD